MSCQQLCLSKRLHNNYNDFNDDDNNNDNNDFDNIDDTVNDDNNEDTANDDNNDDTDKENGTHFKKTSLPKITKKNFCTSLEEFVFCT